MHFFSGAERATRTLQNAGFRLTAPRKKIIAYIANRDNLFSASHIVRALRSIDQASVYRTLRILADLDMIHAVGELDGQQYFEWHTPAKTHHHHLICTYCKKTECIDCVVALPPVRGWRMTHHSFLATGLCASCARKNESFRTTKNRPADAG